jgi:uncharacterized membrane protein
MNADLAISVALAGMAAASFACKIAGFVLMAWIPITPRLQAGLRAMPIGVMTGIVAPSVAAGRPAEIIGLAVVALLLKLTGREVVGALGGAATVGFVRWLQGA